MIKLKETASEIKKELFSKCKTISEDDEFLKTALSFSVTDKVRKAVIEFISNNDNLNEDDVIIFILHMNQDLYGSNDFENMKISE